MLQLRNGQKMEQDICLYESFCCNGENISYTITIAITIQH